MRVDLWNGGELPEAAAAAFHESLRGLGETEDEVSTSLDRAASERNLIFIASDDGRPVGVLIALPKPTTRSAFVLWVVVAPEARRRGVGTALVDALEATPGIEALEVMVDQEDLTALGFWHDRGWAASSGRPGRRQQMEFRLAAGTAQAA